jgi:hypothetical protein
LILFFVAGIGCTSRTDATAALFTGTNVSSLSVTLAPSSLSLSPGGSAVAIGTIRGAPGAIESTVVGVPNGVSARVTSATISDSVTAKKYIFIADANVVPGTYGLTVRITAAGRPATEIPLTLVVATVR